MKAILLTSAIVLASFQSQSANPCTALQTMPVIQVQNASFTFFRVHRQANDASINWGVANPLLIDHYEIERSYDGSFFETIHVMNASLEASCRFRDNTVLPGFIHYRITAYPKEGVPFSTEIQVLRIVSKKI